MLPKGIQKCQSWNIQRQHERWETTEAMAWKTRDDRINSMHPGNRRAPENSKALCVKPRWTYSKDIQTWSIHAINQTSIPEISYKTVPIKPSPSGSYSKSIWQFNCKFHKAICNSKGSFHVMWEWILETDKSTFHVLWEWILDTDKGAFNVLETTVFVHPKITLLPWRTVSFLVFARDVELLEAWSPSSRSLESRNNLLLELMMVWTISLSASSTWKRQMQGCRPWPGLSALHS
jgi:hypothetical protein